jgi:5'-3' exonuclease
MGIKNFNKNIRTYYNASFKKEWLPYYDNVYIDLNFALHSSSCGAKTINEIYSKLFKFVENILLDIHPNKKIYFSTDGSAPISKLLLQRIRRLNISKNDVDNNEATSLLFTPGTNFMTTLKNVMSNFMKYLSFVFSVEVEFISQEFDEAELKIISRKRVVQLSFKKSYL